jgi:hypothetical protein
MGKVFAFSFTAALNPTLLAVVTLMLTLPRPKRLLHGYLLGAVITSVTWGLLLVFALPGSSTANTVKHTVSPLIDIILGVLILLVAVRVARGRDRRIRALSERRHEKAKDKPPPRWKRTLNKGSPRYAFVLGILLTFPGASYLAGMDLLSKQNVGTTEKVIAVLAFNAIMLLLLEVPLIGYVVKPDSTAAAVERFNYWLAHRGGRTALIAALVIGGVLVVLGIVNLV